MKSMNTISALIMLLLLASGCDRFRHIGQPPPMTQITNPIDAKHYKPVSMPQPQPAVMPRHPGANPSLWRAGAKGFFKDPRAAQPGDIITVLVNVKDSAKVDHKIDRNRNASENTSFPALAGLEKDLARIVKNGGNPAAWLSTISNPKYSGEGKMSRGETLSLKVAAVITQVLRNGNFVISGSQEIRISNELRELTVQGVIRPQDVTASNTIDYDRIAEARISYGGRGDLTDVQRPRLGQQILDALAPF